MKFTLEEDSPLLKALEKFFPQSSRRTLQNWIKWGRITVDGIPLSKAMVQIKRGQILSLEKKETSQTVMGIPILYQDRWIIVIDKPAGLLSVPAERDEINAFHLLKAGFKTTSLFPVHR